MKKNREVGKKECLFDSDTKGKRVFPFPHTDKGPCVWDAGVGAVSGSCILNEQAGMGARYAASGVSVAE